MNNRTRSLVWPDHFSLMGHSGMASSRLDAWHPFPIHGHGVLAVQAQWGMHGRDRMAHPFLWDWTAEQPRREPPFSMGDLLVWSVQKDCRRVSRSGRIALAPREGACILDTKKCNRAHEQSFLINARHTHQRCQVSVFEVNYTNAMVPSLTPNALLCPIRSSSALK